MNTQSGWKARLKAFIRGNKGRVTDQRMRVAEVFFSMPSHTGVEELAAEVKRRHRGIGQATIYRTMKLLVDSGLVAAREFGDGFARYEIQEPYEHHDHLICAYCGKILEFKDSAIEAQQERIAKEYGFVIERHRLEIYGRCSECNVRNKNRKG